MTTVLYVQGHLNRSFPRFDTKSVQNAGRVQEVRLTHDQTASSACDTKCWLRHAQHAQHAGGHSNVSTKRYGRVTAVTLLKVCTVFELGKSANACINIRYRYSYVRREQAGRQQKKQKTYMAPNETARRRTTTEESRGPVMYLKKKMGIFRQVVVVSVRKRPTLVVWRAVLGFPAPSSLDTLHAQHMRFQKKGGGRTQKTLCLSGLIKKKG